MIFILEWIKRKWAIGESNDYIRYNDLNVVNSYYKFCFHIK